LLKLSGERTSKLLAEKRLETTGWKPGWETAENPTERLEDYWLLEDRWLLVFWSACLTDWAFELTF
jgi:hypothetical protein